ncbi:MAG: Holliday junction resolvase RuvX [Candidatus Moranbacteria bacterium CG_4_8_14_3_um_filter_34_16]|nr:MAG: Holliday junction resolvase RuvX [Candidatus Moranbacteria bacterium CG08_land_8_20_14_0_20_34_16]PIW94925.1 MAG: Holliday junction resolvase RuvX [Candidatus Moranbacteria bacterium CG_4_8_14_3_um_filter_34_16]PJA89159.1 MAG: Holliday junction resolvase RuvX [Candidatus Moranbacteria bacterium CG_4_9_14_3_um_filter_33_15]
MKKNLKEKFKFSPDFPSYYLGIDYGESRVGLALADEEMRIAFSWDVIKNDKSFFANLSGIIKKKKIKEVIIGIPFFVGLVKNEYAGKKLGDFLQKKIGVKVAYQNEMFSTKMAHFNLKKQGKKEIKKYDDKEAARIILQEWLDNKKIIK